LKPGGAFKSYVVKSEFNSYSPTDVSPPLPPPPPPLPPLPPPAAAGAPAPAAAALPPWPGNCGCCEDPLPDDAAPETPAAVVVAPAAAVVAPAAPV
jgi:hypothetical protein